MGVLASIGATLKKLMEMTSEEMLCTSCKQNGCLTSMEARISHPKKDHGFFTERKPARGEEKPWFNGCLTSKDVDFMTTYGGLGGLTRAHVLFWLQ